MRKISDTIRVYNAAGEYAIIEKSDLEEFITVYGFSTDKPDPAKRETISEPEPESEEVEETEDEEKPRRGRPAQKKR
ncbi:MAG: hypothetical protein PHW66_09990 [Gallionella sp.]|nr:hypothetical protein [Gallionella sp.]